MTYIPFAIKKKLYARRVDTQYNPLHKHIEWEIIIPIKGRVTHYINDIPHLLLPTDIIMSKPYDFHRIENLTDEAYEHFDLYFSNKDIQKVCDAISPNLFSMMSQSSNFFHLKVDEGYLNEIIEQMHMLIYLQDIEPTSVLTLAVFNTLLFSIVGKFIQNEIHYSNEIPKWFRELLVRINNPSMIESSINDIVKTTNYTHGRLCALFKQHMGCTLIAYMKGVKMECAKRLMRNTDLNILDICNKVGYSSLSHFIKLFTEYTEMTPKKYRQNVLHL